MQRLALIFFIIAVAVSTAIVVATGQQLPDRVASHFGLDGHADSYLPREQYMLLFTFLVSLLPVAIAGSMAFLIRVVPRLVRMRNRDYWLQPEHRSAAIDYMTLRGLLMGGLLALFLAAVHYVVVVANRLQPPRLSSPTFVVMVTVFVLVFVVGSIASRLYFERIPPDARTNG